MALIENQVVDSIELLPEIRHVNVRVKTKIVDDITNQVRGENNWRRSYKIGVDDDELRVVLGTDKANLIIANL